MKGAANPGMEKVALLTGAARRLGAAIAAHLHAGGYRIAIHYHRSETDALRLCQILNRRRSHSAAAFGADLLELEALSRLIDAVASHWGRLDVVVNNASAFYPTPIGEVTDRHWDELLGTNLRAPFFLIQRAAPWLIASEGCVVNLVDVHADRPLLGHSLYGITKAGLVALTKALAKELAPRVRVNAVAPGAILWPEQDADPARQAETLSRIPLARAGEPMDIARAVDYLVGQAPYVTGQVITVDGGRSLFG